MSTTPMPVAAAADALLPAEHMPHPPNPGDGPAQLSNKHANVVNYAISAGGVVLGVALITTFALICRWRRRRRQRALDDQIDERVREKTLSCLEANRTHSLAKLPAAALASNREQSVLRPLPWLTTHSANSSVETLSESRPRQTCMRASDQRLPCGCPDCVVFARSSTLAPSVSASALASIHATVRHSPSHRQPRSVSSFVRGRHSPHRSALRPLSLGSSASQSQRRTDENMHRAASIRSPSPRVASPYDYTHAFGRSAASTYPRGAGVGVGMGIMVAATTGSLGCPSPAPTTPSLGFSTPRTGTSLSGSPAPSLSDDAGATTLNPIVISDGHEHDSEHSPSAASSATIRPFASVDASVSRGHLELGPSLAHMQVSPLVQDNTAGSPAPSISGVTPSQIKSGDIPFSPRAEGEQQQQGWFTEVDWFGVDGPLACYEPRV